MRISDRSQSVLFRSNTTPGVYFPTVLSESCRIFRRYTRLRFKPVRKVVVIDRIEIRSDVKTDAVLVERSFLHKGFSIFPKCLIYRKRLSVLKSITKGRAPVATLLSEDRSISHC